MKGKKYKTIRRYKTKHLNLYNVIRRECGQTLARVRVSRT